VIGNRAGVESSEDFSIRIGEHRVGQTILIRPSCRLLASFLDAYGIDLQALILVYLPDVLVDNRSLLLTTPSKGLPENEKNRRPPEVRQHTIAIYAEILGRLPHFQAARQILENLHSPSSFVYAQRTGRPSCFIQLVQNDDPH
jgi:hypothetical protein